MSQTWCFFVTKSFFVKWKGLSWGHFLFYFFLKHVAQQSQWISLIILFLINPNYWLKCAQRNIKLWMNFRSEPSCNSGISSQHLVQNWDCLQNACLMLRLVPQLWTHLQISLLLHLFLNFMLWWLIPSAVNWNSKIKESLVSGLEPFLTLSPLWVSKDTSPGKCSLSS